MVSEKIHDNLSKASAYLENANHERDRAGSPTIPSRQTN